MAAATAIGLTAGVNVLPRTTSSFDVRFDAADYHADPRGGVVTTLTLANRTRAPVTLTGVSLGPQDAQSFGLGRALLALSLDPGQRKVVAVHSDLDCRPDHPAVPSDAAIAGHDAEGRARSVQSTLPGSSAFAAVIAAYRDTACKAPYPFSIARVRYAGLHSIGATSHDRFSMQIDVTVDAAAADVPVTVLAVASDVHGTEAAMRDNQGVTVGPGGTAHLLVDWTIDDCHAVPTDTKTYSVVLTITDEHATQTRRWIPGRQFSADLLGSVSNACQREGIAVIDKPVA